MGKAAGPGPTLLCPSGNASEAKFDDNKAMAMHISARVRVTKTLNACGVGTAQVIKLETGEEGTVMDIKDKSFVIRFDKFVAEYEALRVLKSDLKKLEVLQDPQAGQP